MDYLVDGRGYQLISTALIALSIGTVYFVYMTRKDNKEKKDQAERNQESPLQDITDNNPVNWRN